MTILRVEPGHGPVPIRTEFKSEPPLEWLQEQVGGFIEIVRFMLDTDKGQLEAQMVIDEEGKLKGKQQNAVATALYANPNDVIVGTAIILVGEHKCT